MFFSSSLLFIIFAGITAYWLFQPVKRVIVQPVDVPTGKVSQQTWLSDKPRWKVIWESGPVTLVRAILMLIGMGWVVSWIF